MTPSCQARATRIRLQFAPAPVWSVFFSPSFFSHCYLLGTAPCVLVRAPPAQQAAPMHDDLDKGSTASALPTSQDVPTASTILPSMGLPTPVAGTSRLPSRERDPRRFSFTSGQGEDPQRTSFFFQPFFFGGLPPPLAHRGRQPRPVAAGFHLGHLPRRVFCGMGDLQPTFFPTKVQ